jgi:hypothetical protein
MRERSLDTDANQTLMLRELWTGYLIEAPLAELCEEIWEARPASAV